MPFEYQAIDLTEETYDLPSQAMEKINANMELLADWTGEGGVDLDSIYERLALLESSFFGTPYSRDIVPFDQTASGQEVVAFSIGSASYIHKFEVIVDTAASSGSPTLSIGIETDTDYFSSTSEVNLKSVGVYELNINMQVDDQIDVWLFVTADSQTFSGRINMFGNLSEYVPPEPPPEPPPD